MEKMMKMKVGGVDEWRLTYMKMKMNVGKESVMGKMMMTWQRGGDDVLTWLKNVMWRVMWIGSNLTVKPVKIDGFATSDPICT